MLKMNQTQSPDHQIIHCLEVGNTLHTLHCHWQKPNQTVKHNLWATAGCVTCPHSAITTHSLSCPTLCVWKSIRGIRDKVASVLSPFPSICCHETSCLGQRASLLGWGTLASLCLPAHNHTAPGKHTKVSAFRRYVPASASYHAALFVYACLFV